MRLLGIALSLLLVTACAQQGVRCDKTLRPINAPAAVAKKPASVEPAAQRKP